MRSPQTGGNDVRAPSLCAAPVRLGRRQPASTLDVITIGRSSVDLYGQQIGGRLEDMATFAKSVGGCPANIAIGTARLGLKSALITRVGDEHMGRFIREQLQREGVDDARRATDPEPPHRARACSACATKSTSR